MATAANQGWRDYWKSDRPASCVPDNEATAKEIAAYWIDMFAELPDGSRALDIATGNGIVLAHAVTAAGQCGKTFELTGVDLAEIEPRQFLSEFPAGFEHVHFVGNTAAEDLPFGDGEFDVVVSQYGLEYAELEKALAEIERVLVPGGRLVWLAHSEESEVVQQNRHQGAQVEYLLAPRGPVDAMEKFIARISKGKSLSYAGRRLQAALVDAEAYRREHPPANIVTEVCTVIAETANRWQAYRPSDLANMLSDSRQRLIRHRQRINDLVNAVISPDRLQRVEQHLQAGCWSDTSIETLRAGVGRLPIGRLITSRRRASPDSS